MIFRHGSLNRRDALLLLLGASSMHIWSMLFGTAMAPSDQSIVINTHLQHNGDAQEQLLAHAPGWTMFRNLYMSNGTIFIVADENSRKRFPEIRMITSTGLEAENTPENIAMREPTEENMRIITPQEAKARWVSIPSDRKANVENRVWSVEGNTLLFNDPKQFLRHYYHFVAELFFGVQAFWHGAFSAPITPADALTASSPTHFSLSHPAAPPMHRAIFAHSNADGWRDDPGFNSYFLRAALPSLIVEHQEDWNDRIIATRPVGDQPERAWHFPIVLFTDRSAAHRGRMCGSTTQRTASEAWDYMRLHGKLRGLHIGGWWAPLREAVWRFAGAPEASGITTRNRDDKQLLPMPERIVISYISRQGARNRKLIPRDHEALVKSMKELRKRRQLDGQIPPEWEFNELLAERMTKDDQVKAAARTTIMLGVHGNGLTHLVFMKPNRASTVIEIFYPKGFAHDYHWTTRSLGMTHVAVWNDKIYTHPEKPGVDYPEGFQGNEIPVHGPTIAKLIEDRVAGKI
ncbi:hypothetical protein M413DRAFT_71332 [Hebeloma cylindrosporum]|uniref:Glycosyltransferase 61 catalytic domain-containing protein n=1 Tax=Hebeloma cylindrosporum TaxID=76867 RepID=A0A0C3BZQ4_HEBCY|nr:hypothetical protein M413DRAFT_71332 [Hebeloma cylindrosporum h7]